ncbi:MAG: F0F1 ATP synthase subunit A [Clostridiales bacterium]|nr:F0F1 ATP synthase subunit A [Clostridiales bacterium]
MSIAEKVMEELNCEIAFSIGGIDIMESTAVTWIIMVVLLLASFLLTRNLKVQDIGKRQAAVEFCVTKLEDIVTDMVGEKGRSYTPYLITVLLYIGFANLIGIFGFKPPTKDLNVTIALAAMSIILVQVAAVRAKGTKGWLHSFLEPVPVVVPFNILDLITRPLSLCMRLFGNVLGAFVIMKLIEAVVPAIFPMIASLYFDVFDGILQAYVFVFLTSIYIKEAIE